MIAFEDVRAGYGERIVLQGVNLRIAAGEMVGLLGPNGSGKTTLLLAACGALAPTAGRVLLGGGDLKGMAPKARARRSASVPQRMDPGLGLTVSALVLMGRYPYLSFLGSYGREDRDAAERAMEQTGTLELAGRRTEELSGGEFQRSLMARALAQDTDVLFLDEASSGLDIAFKREIHDLLKARHAQGLTVVSAIHDLNLAALYCDRLIFLKKGRVVLDGPVEDVFTAANLTDIYETDVLVFPHPATGAPQSCLLPGPGPGGHDRG